jgi:hypothetical protein
MHLHPDSVLPFAQLQCARMAWHPKVPMTATRATTQFALASNDEAASSAFIKDSAGSQLEIELEHGASDRRSADRKIQ